jgi:ABC-2 type transport system permease protein
MKHMKASLWMEILKVRRTKIFPVSIYFFIFIGAMMGFLMFVARHPEIAHRSATISTKTSFLPGSDWKAFFNLMIQFVLILGAIGSGIVTSWDFGREFSDRTVKDLLALPVSRSTIVLSKLIVLMIWSILLSVCALVAAIVSGLLLQIPGWTGGALAPFLATYMVCVLFNSLLITPVAFVASAGRGYILPISFVILILILTQLLFVGLPDLSFWFPWSLPALFSGVAGEALPPPGFLSYFIFAFTVLAGLIGTMAWWRYADHK